MDETKAEIRRLNALLKKAGTSEVRIKTLKPIVENTAHMKVKLDETLVIMSETDVAIQYDNGGGQTGIRENPIFKGYEALWRSYMSGMNVIMSALPPEIGKQEKEKADEQRNVLQLVREKHRA